MTTKLGRPPKGNITKEYLEEYYIRQLWSMAKVAKYLGCNAGSIKYYLNKYEIPTRNLSYSHRINGYEFNGDEDVLYGSMLGDGSILRRNKNGLASFSKCNIGYDHIVYIGNKILGHNCENRIYEYQPKLSKRPAFKFTTLCCDRFLLEYNKWYPKGKKIVPKDLKLTPGIILHWFMDDGHSSWRNSQKNRTIIGLSTESFTKHDCEFLSENLYRLGIETRLGKSHGGYGFKIFVRSESNRSFFDLIGQCPIEIPSMKYKWKIV